MDTVLTTVAAITASAPAWAGAAFVALVAASCVLIPRRDLDDELRRHLPEERD